ncbi:unnamed protein product [Mytilus edulis]|uniref:Reverse transcriptase domain-containing protein n=1 Tax=Mytilus edulis TaxID=6550 RepID=A0A8S3U171_MYTED|nr:unnamed protein product [Mytilus edulis]
MNTAMQQFLIVELQVASYESRVASYESRVASYESRVASYKSRVASYKVELRVKKVELRVTEVELRVTKVVLRVTNVELRVTKVELRVTKVELRVTKVKLRVKKVELRVTKVEMRVTKVELRVTKVELRVTKVELRATKVELRVTKVELRVTKVELRVKKVELRVTKVELRVLKVELRVTKVELRVTKVELRVTKIIFDKACIAVNGEILIHPVEKATAINDYFCSISRFDTEPQLPNVPPLAPYELSDIVITEQDVIEHSQILNINKPAGPDKLPPKFLKAIFQSLVTPLTFIINKSLQTGIVPSDWKLANVSAIYKCIGDQDSVSNYRPISVTYCFRKNIFKSLHNYMHDHAILTDQQSGFRIKDSTINQLLLLYDEIVKNLDKGKDVRFIL